MFFARKRSANVAAAEGLFVRKRSDSNSTDAGHEDVITGCDALSLRSPIANPREIAQPPLQSTILLACIFWHSL